MFPNLDVFGSVAVVCPHRHGQKNCDDSWCCSQDNTDGLSMLVQLRGLTYTQQFDGLQLFLEDLYGCKTRSGSDDLEGQDLEMLQIRQAELPIQCLSMKYILRPMLTE